MNFLKCFEMQDDEMLSIQGGTNDWVIYIAIIFIVAVFFQLVFLQPYKIYYDFILLSASFESG